MRARSRHPFVVALQLILLAALLTSMSCDGHGGGTVTGDRLNLAGCTERTPTLIEPFRMDLVFLGVSVGEETTALLRMGVTYRFQDESDVFVVAVSDRDLIQSEIASAGEALRPVGPSAIHAGFSLPIRCPKSTESLVATNGTARFLSFGVKSGDRVWGVLDFDVMDQRSGVVIGTGFHADFDFTVEVSKPHQLYNDPRWQNPEL